MRKPTRKEKLINYIYNCEENERNYIFEGKECKSVHYSMYELNRMSYLELCEIIEWFFRLDLYAILDILQIKH